MSCVDLTLNQKYCFMWCGKRGCECEQRVANSDLFFPTPPTFDDHLKAVWVDLTLKFGQAVREGDSQTREYIVDIIYKLEHVYPDMQRMYLHTFPGDKTSEH